MSPVIFKNAEPNAKKEFESRRRIMGGHEQVDIDMPKMPLHRTDLMHCGPAGASW